MSVRNPKRSSERFVTVGAASIEVVPFAADRTALTLGAIGGTIFVTKQPTATVTGGLPIVNGTTPFTLCQCHGGDWVKGPIFAIADGAARTLIVIEGFEPAGAGVSDYGESPV